MSLLTGIGLIAGGFGSLVTFGWWRNRLRQATAADVYTEDVTAVRPYVVPAWTETVIDGDQMAMDMHFADLTRQAAATWQQATR